MTDSPARLFSTRGSERFLADHWQREPLFLRAALPALPPTPQWRALAASDEVESRRIVTLADGRLRLSDGPITSADPAQPWTVLIQDADFHAPALRALFHAIDFLPTWRTEDIMMSVASAGGSVGPHVDAYDVFLVQARGTRRWQIGRAGEYESAPHDGGLRLVKPFDAALSVVAAPGDVLYLPPDVPHYGVAENDCITYSIGFRAPTLHELSAVALEKLSSEPRYTDAGAERATDPARIDAPTIARLRQQLGAFLALDDATLAAALGEVMTEMKPWLAPDDARADDAAVTLPCGSPHLATWPGMRLARYDDDAGGMLFANGQSYPLEEPGQVAIADNLSRHGHATCPDQPACRVLAQSLLDDGIVRIAHDN